MMVLLVNYSTAQFEKTISAENDPIYTEAKLQPLFFPPGDYRVIAGRLMRLREGLPPANLEENPPPTPDTTSAS